MNDLPIVIIVGAGSFQIPAIMEAKRMGLFVVALDGNNDAPGFEFADERIVVDIRNPEACLREVKELRPAAALGLATEVAVVTVAAIAEHYGLKGPSVEAAYNCTSKLRMRQRFMENAIPSPRFHLITDEKDLNSLSQLFGYPLVIKPSDSAGSRGVSIVSSLEGLHDAFHHAAKFSVSGEILIEEFMEGVEISVEAFIQDGDVTILALSDKKRTESLYPLDTQVIFPSTKSLEVQRQARGVARAAIKACKVDNAVVHMEMIVTPNGPKMVELAARGAGFHVFSKMLAWVCDINTVKLLIDISLGNKVELNNIKQRGAVLSFPFSDAGTVVSVEGISDVKAIPGIHDVEVYVKEGDKVNELRSGSDRVAHIIAFGNTRAEAESIAGEAENLIKIKLD